MSFQANRDFDWTFQDRFHDNRDDEYNEAAMRLNERKLRSYGLWNGDDPMETPFPNEVSLTCYGTKGKRNY